VFILDEFRELGIGGFEFGLFWFLRFNLLDCFLGVFGILRRIVVEIS
jgi:uncharacterized membrane protein YuzA (DUF378 family)